MGKTVIFLGSSITYGYAAGGISFADFVCERNGYTMVKEAVNGTTLVDVEEVSYISRMKKLDTPKADLFVCQLSTNDATRDLAISDIEEAIRFIVKYATEKWNCPIMFYTNPKYDNKKYEEMVGLLLQLATELDIKVLDFWNDEKINRLTKENMDRYMADPIHPTKEGYLELWTPAVELFIQEHNLLASS